MVINKSEMKRKRKEECSSPLLDDSPKRTKVHAQRKFAQGSNVNSPVITPVQEIEKQEIDIMPEPVELLPIKRPNTEDFLTFLCFRGTPILPPSLNFFNTASIVDTNGQVHEIKSESPKNGPIDTSALTKSGAGSSEKPFVAFGVRKRADPIVISRQMDKKRRHALALQALRRKYQEQKMAKIRAVAISKISEKVTNKTLVRSNSVTKTETVTKKTSSVQKTKVVVEPPPKVTAPTLRSQIKPKMCLRSFRGRFVQKELQFRNVKKRPITLKKPTKSTSDIKAKDESPSDESDTSTSEYSSDDEKPLSKTTKEVKDAPVVPLPKIAKKSASGPKKPMEINFRITRSNKFINSKIAVRRQQIKKRLLINTPKTIVKPRTLRSNTTLKSKSLPETKQKLIQKRKQLETEKMAKKNVLKVIENSKKDNAKKEVRKSVESVKKEIKTTESIKKVTNKSAEAVKKDTTVVEAIKNNVNKTIPNVKKNLKVVESVKKAKTVVPTEVAKKIEPAETSKKVNLNKKIVKPIVPLKKVLTKTVETASKPVRKEAKLVENPDKKEESLKTDQKEMVELRTSQRPSRKTKEAAAIYMEILSHKLVNESKIDDDNVSIDSFPELPNVKRTEQRENELKAKAKCNKSSESETDKKTTKPKPQDATDGKNLRSAERRKNFSQNKIANIKSLENENIKRAIIEDTINQKKKSLNIEKEEKSEDEKREEQIKKLVEETAKKTQIKIVKDENEKPSLQVSDRKTRSTNSEKVNKNPISSHAEKPNDVEVIKPPEVEDKVPIPELKESPVKRKLADKTDTAEESECEMKQTKLRKSEESEKFKPLEIETTKRQTRNSSQNLKQSTDDDSDESFHIDVKIPRKRQVTRSKVLRNYKTDDDEDSSTSSDDREKTSIKKALRTTKTSYRECSFSESDQSTTSDVIVRPQIKPNKNKKFTKTRSLQKSEPSFSDSDEEPLSKLTQNKTGALKDLTIATDLKKISSVSGKTDVSEVKIVEMKDEKTNFTKPKRECAKRPQNYLPMFSSSDEEDQYFHGFKVKTEAKTVIKTKIVETTCIHPTSSDLSCKDIGRRFGKGKVNMSTEQIEKWLKDAAMAGNSVKSENDEMLKFGEKIPTETSLSIASSIDTEKLKNLLVIADEKQTIDIDKKALDLSMKEVSSEKQAKVNLLMKPGIVDRKLIFRNKDKVLLKPNVNAFSASNESSVYAFGEEAEDIMKTPFRRPSRRPSSTATSRSEDESSKCDEFSKSGQFRKPSVLKPDVAKLSKDLSTGEDQSEDNTIANQENDDRIFYTPTSSIRGKSVQSEGKCELKPSTSMVPPSTTMQKSRELKHPVHIKAKSFDRMSEASEEFKYKVPSSPSASSSSSAKLYKRQNSKPKLRATEIIPVKLTEFPTGNNSGQLVEAPTFYPSEKEFQDPLEYIEKIRAKAEQFGVCRIVPPATFKPECKVTDDMRFTAYNQYVHKMLHRWGPNFKELMAIKKYLSTQNISLTHPPWIGGMEIDLPRLYQTVQSLGGLKEVIEKKKWPKVSEAMKIPKSAQDRVTKLDDIYCKYLLPYDTLSPAEREKLFDEVETDWAKRESKSLLKAQQDVEVDDNESDSQSDDEAEECIVKGRNMALNAFYRIARNTMSMWFKTTEPPAQEVEQEFWKHVTLKQNHLCVHSGSIDSGNWGYGFAVSKNSPFARHAWNLKVLTNNSGSVLRSLGPIMGVTVPTLHVGMVFSSCCWYRDPHSLPWVEYLHTGGNKIWYGIPNSTSVSFHSAMKRLVPNYCRNKTLWLPSDTVMVPPNLLVENGVSLSRIVQEPGQFIIVFPKVFTSSLSTGYVVSESVYFAPPYWLRTARGVFDELRNSCEPSMFSLDRLVLSIVNDSRSSVDVLRQIIPAVQEICDNEKLKRDKVKGLGVVTVEKLPLPEAPNARKKRKLQGDDGEYECEICRMNLFVSMIAESQEDVVYCLDHAIEELKKTKIQSKNCTLMYTYDDEELGKLVEKINLTIENKGQKKVPNKYAGMPTLLTK